MEIEKYVKIYDEFADPEWNTVEKKIAKETTIPYIMDRSVIKVRLAEKLGINEFREQYMPHAQRYYQPGSLEYNFIQDAPFYKHEYVFKTIDPYKDYNFNLKSSFSFLFNNESSFN